MERTKMNKGLIIFLGITLFTQAVTALVGGSIFLGPFDSNEITHITMSTISNSVQVANISILLQMITAVVIIMLGVAMYRVAGYINMTMAIIALSLYILEAVLLSIGQVFTFALVELSQVYVDGLDANLLAIGKVLLSCREFSGSIAMIPFGLGAVMFYYLLLKAEILPKWLAMWGIATAPLILVGVTLMAFGVAIPFVLLVPYVPFEFFTGIYILIRYRAISHKETFGNLQ